MINNAPNEQIKNAVDNLRQGKIIAYPTEAIYGLGCDPFNQAAVDRLLKIKNRPEEKGFILIADNWQRVENLVKPIDKTLLKKILSTWPNHITWIFPASSKTPEWIRGAHTTIAIRITSFPVAKKLCEMFEKPIISTSANIEGTKPLKTEKEVKKIFKNQIDYIIDAPVGNHEKPSEMREALTGNVIRE